MDTEKYWIFLLGFLLGGLFLCPSHADTRVYILAGQSNMQGGEHIPISLPSNVKVYDKTTYLGSYLPGNVIGPEAGIAQVLGSQYPSDTIILIKHAVGGRSMLDWVYGGMNTDGRIQPAILNSPENNPNPANTPESYEMKESGIFFDGIISSVQQMLKNENLHETYEISGVFWMQGEADAYQYQKILLDNSLYTQYSYNLHKLIRQFETHFNMAEDYKIVIGRIHNYTLYEQMEFIPDIPFSDLTLKENFEAIRKAQSNVSGDNVRVVSTDEFNLVDRWHFTGQHYVSLGKCMALGILQEAKLNGCSTTGNLTSEYPMDEYTDDPNVEANQTLVKDLFIQYQNRHPGYSGYRFWINALHNDYGVAYNDLASGLSGNSQDYSTSCRDVGGKVIGGHCHFGWSCVTQQEAVDIINFITPSYSSCSGVVPNRHSDCSEGVSAERAYLVKCPLLNPIEEVPEQEQLTTTGQKVYWLFNKYLKRNPGQEGYTFWKANFQDLETSLQDIVVGQEEHP